MTDLSNSVENINKDLTNLRCNIVDTVYLLINCCINAAGGDNLTLYSGVVKKLGGHAVEVTINDFTFTHHFAKKDLKRLHQTIQYDNGDIVELKHLIEDSNSIYPELRQQITDLRQEIGFACIQLVEKEKCMKAWSPFLMYTIQQKKSATKKDIPTVLDYKSPDEVLTLSDVGDLD